MFNLICKCYWRTHSGPFRLCFRLYPRALWFPQLLSVSGAESMTLIDRLRTSHFSGYIFYNHWAKIRWHYPTFIASVTKAVIITMRSSNNTTIIINDIVSHLALLKAEWIPSTRKENEAKVASPTRASASVLLLALAWPSRHESQEWPFSDGPGL